MLLHIKNLTDKIRKSLKIKKFKQKPILSLHKKIG